MNASLFIAAILLLWQVAGATLRIEMRGNNVNLSWDQELGANHYVVQASSDPYNFINCEEMVVTTTTCNWSVSGGRKFFRVVPIKDFVSITAKRTTYVPDRGRLSIDSCYVTVEQEGVEHPSYRMYKPDRQVVIKDGYQLSWEGQEFKSKKQVVTNSGDLSLNLDNGYFQFMGKRFDYLAWANANGWSVDNLGNRYVLSNGADSLLIDAASTLLINKISQWGDKTFKTEFIWKNIGGTPVLWHVNRLEYRADSLYRLIREEYSDWVINTEAQINVRPEDYPDLTLPAMPQLTEVERLQSNCPVRTYVEDVSQAIPSSLRSGTPAQISCTQCHTQVGQGFILLHGLASNPAVMDPLEFYLQQNFPSSIVIRPYMPHEYSIAQMIDSLSARLPLFGAIEWMGIGHSQGGLVGRGLAQRNLLSQMLVLASPQQGSPLAQQENIDYAMWIFNDLHSSLNSCDNWFGWATNIFSDGASSLNVMRNQLEYILNCGSIVDLRPGSDFITDLNADSTLVPHRTLKAKFDRDNPVKGMWAGLTTQYTFPYPYAQMDNLRMTRFNTIQSNWNNWIDDCENFNWIDPINSLRHDLEGMEDRWRDNVVEAGVLEVRTEPFYTYHNPGTCFYCAYTPACVTNAPDGDGGREFYCDSFEEQDGSVLWCCNEEDGCNGTYRCYHGEMVVEVVYAENDGVVRNVEENYGDGWPIDNVDHFSATRSTAFNQDIYETIQLWRP